MTVLCKQIDHGSLDISEREAAMASFEREAGADAPGSVTLRTCNRLEVYSGGGIIPPGVARHLMRVASGLESQLIGERAVGGQVREAYMDAKASCTNCSRAPYTRGRGSGARPGCRQGR